jgi:hypothetical protein
VTEDVAQWVEHLSGTCKALGLIPSHTKNCETLLSFRTTDKLVIIALFHRCSDKNEQKRVSGVASQVVAQGRILKPQYHPQEKYQLLQ